ncbi:MAG: lipoyl(octanoyl) transferase LipB [Rhodothalassiaceae bacterium]
MVRNKLRDHRETPPDRPDALEWRVSDTPVAYPAALAAMQARVADIRAGQAAEQIWLLEHPPLYTAGTSAKTDHLINPLGLPVYEAGRGGQYTYHGPGQRVVYVMLDLARRARDLRRFVGTLEQWVIDTLAAFDIVAERRDGRVGVWVATPQGDKKIAAIGVRVRHWVTFHGLSVNVQPELSHFDGIVPCGLAEYGVTSLTNLGHQTSLAAVDQALRRHCPF